MKAREAGGREMEARDSGTTEEKTRKGAQRFKGD